MLRRLVISGAAVCAVIATVGIAQADGAETPNAAAAAVHVSVLDRAVPVIPAGDKAGQSAATTSPSLDATGRNAVTQALQISHLDPARTSAVLARTTPAGAVYITTDPDGSMCVVLARTANDVAFSCTTKAILAQRAAFLGFSADGSSIDAILVSADGFNEATFTSASTGAAVNASITDNVTYWKISPDQTEISLKGQSGTQTFSLGNLGRK